MHDVPGLRMPLLSGLLRLADILDESRHRACRQKAQTLLLDLESQTHWWRHYYTRDVTFDSNRKAITIWFEFPHERVDEYERVIPELQLPWIRAELDHHRAAFSQAGVAWNLEHKTTMSPYSTVEEMPDSVLGEMLKQLRRRQVKKEEEGYLVALQTFKAARPFIEHRLQELRETKASMPVDQYLTELAQLSRDLWNIGSRRSAWMCLNGPFQEGYGALTAAQRVAIGCQLLEMVIEDGAPDAVKQCVGQLQEEIRCLSAADAERKAPAQELLAEWLFQECAYREAVDAFTLAREYASGTERAATIDARLRELHYLQGDLEKATLRASPIRRPVAFMALKGPDSIAQGEGRRSPGYCHAHKKSKSPERAR